MRKAITALIGTTLVTIVGLALRRRYMRCPVNKKYCPDYKDCRNKNHCWLK